MQDQSTAVLPDCFWWLEDSLLAHENLLLHVIVAFVTMCHQFVARSSGISLQTNLTSPALFFHEVTWAPCRYTSAELPCTGMQRQVYTHRRPVHESTSGTPKLTVGLLMYTCFKPFWLSVTVPAAAMPESSPAILTRSQCLLNSDMVQRQPSAYGVAGVGSSTLYQGDFVSRDGGALTGMHCKHGMLRDQACILRKRSDGNSSLGKFLSSDRAND